MRSLDGRLTIAINGEIYNFRELRTRLPGPWQSESDTEIVLAAYARWGYRCVDHLRGMFAFAIWDAEREELFLARDRFGVKPLYYVQDSESQTLAFASEVRALMGAGVLQPRLSTNGLEAYLSYQTVAAPETLVEGVTALPPGHCLLIRRDGSQTTYQYWDLLERAAALNEESRGEDELTVRKHVRELLQEAVQLHLVSDVPVGAFLSGGIDSSAIVALMHESGIRPSTFTVGFAGAQDETAYARQVAHQFATDHHEIVLQEGHVRDQIGDALAAMDQPSGDGVNTYVVSRAVAGAGLKVALSGLGGDELFGGYPSFARLARLAPAMRIWGRAPLTVRAAAARAIDALGGSSIAASKAAALLVGDGSLAAMYPTTRQVLSAQQRASLLDPRWARAVPANNATRRYVGLLDSAFRRSAHAGLLAHVSYAEARTYMHDLLLRDTDQMSMAHALEVRVPLLDHVLAEYVVGLPDRLKRSTATPKRLLVESLGDALLPETVRRPKQGFTLPFAGWMRGPLEPFCSQQLENLAQRRVLRPEALDALWHQFKEGRPTVSWSRIWLLVTLEHWLEQHSVETPVPISV